MKSSVKTSSAKLEFHTCITTLEGVAPSITATLNDEGETARAGAGTQTPESVMVSSPHVLSETRFSVPLYTPSWAGAKTTTTGLDAPGSIVSSAMVAVNPSDPSNPVTVRTVLPRLYRYTVWVAVHPP